MSIRQVLATTRALLEDPVLGFKAKTVALAAGDATILTDLAFVKWSLQGTMQKATTVNVMMRPVSWRPNPKNEGRPHRDGFFGLEVAVEMFSADPEIIENNVSLLAVALAQAIDELLPYSVANAGTIGDLEDPIDFQFGQFVGPTSHGFLCRFTGFERSSQ